MAVISFLKPKNKLEEGGRAAAPVQSDPGEPEQLCPNCHKSIPVSHLWDRNRVCSCGHHFRMNARQRIAMLTDKGSFRELFRDVQSDNPLSFPGYDGKLESARSASGEAEAVVCGSAEIGGQKCAVFFMDPGFMMGSMGSAVMVFDFDNFDPKQLCTVINRYGVTSFCAPPTVYRYLVRKGIPDMPSLRHASTAGEILAPEVFRKFAQRTGLELCEGYGQTETTLLMANFKGMQPVEGSMGTISPLYHIELQDKSGNPVSDGEIGEVVILPPEKGRQIGVFSGYLDNAEQYRHVWRGGVYHTGDAAYRDSEGRYWFHGRFDDIIKTGGYRVGPYEVENVLMAHPAVVECSVIGVPDKLRGQAIKAFIVLGNRQPSLELEKEIKDFCNARLAEYKWVRLIEFVSEMPKTISGKIRKTELRAAT